MTAPGAEVDERGRLERELAYYKNELNEVGARLLRAQEEQGRVAREARRSRIAVRLLREIYRLAETGTAPAAIGQAVLTIVADTALCDHAALLTETAGGRFIVEHAIGAAAGAGLVLEAPPAAFLFTSGRHGAPDAAGMTALLGTPHILWAYDARSGHALLMGNRSESNIHRPFEAGDRELVEGALAVYLDVLLLKQAEAKLLQAKAAAEEASEARSNFLATLSHELRTPLNAIIGFSEILLLERQVPEAPERRAEYIQQILDSGRGLLVLVKDVLDFSAFSHAVPRLRPAWVPLEQLLQMAARIFNVANGGHVIGVAVEPAARGLELNVDYDRIRQVLSNLLGNAAKFTRPGGSISLLADQTAAGEVRLAVRDSGIGIAAEDLPRVLEPFVQLDHTFARAPGTGLGLPICRRLIEAHGGRLEIASTLGAGTTVTVALPSALARIAQLPAA